MSGGKTRQFRRCEKSSGKWNWPKENSSKRRGFRSWDPRLRRWRELSLAAFERAWANATRRGIDLRDDQAGALYAHCLARTMMREGIGASDSRQSDETIKRLVEEVFY